MASQETDKGYNVDGEGTEELSFSCKSCDYKHKKEGTMKTGQEGNLLRGG